MPKKLPEHPRSVRNLMDADRVSEYLGIARGTLRAWEHRRASGGAGGPKDFPPPIEDRLGGASLWEEADIVAYRRRRDAASKEGGDPGDPSKSATTP